MAAVRKRTGGPKVSAGLEKMASPITLRSSTTFLAAAEMASYGMTASVSAPVGRKARAIRGAASLPNAGLT